MRLALGASTAGIGLGALAAPETTVRVAGLVFGLDLLVTGLLRAALGVAGRGAPGGYRFCSGILGLEIAALGIVCLRLPDASAPLLVLLVSVGWLLAGLIGIAAGVAGGRPWSRWYAAIGGTVTLTAVVVLVRPGLGSPEFLVIGVVLLVVTGIGEIAVTAAGIRAAAYAAPPSLLPRPRHGAI
jgi:uncharacterized membrane protein HdeD (DUF308 family)